MTDDRVALSRDPNFWDKQYRSGETGWDLGGPSPVLEAALHLGLLGEPGRVFVPGAGHGHDALLLARHGHRPLAVDFSASAVGSLREAAREATLDVDAREADIFSFREEPAGSFDAVFEYTCFVAIDPAWRERYVALVTHLVRPGGRLFFLAFPLGRTDPGPPHGLTLKELASRFGAHWRWVADGSSSLSPAPRRGMERWVLLERNDVPAPSGDERPAPSSEARAPD